jgi:hypothetical protein
MISSSQCKVGTSVAVLVVSALGVYYCLKPYQRDRIYIAVHQLISADADAQKRADTGVRP